MTIETAKVCAAKVRMFARASEKGPAYCRRSVALRSLVDARGETRYYCQAEGHRGLVVRTYGEWTEPESADGITAAKYRDELMEGVAHFEWHGHDIIVEVV